MSKKGGGKIERTPRKPCPPPAEMAKRIKNVEYIEAVYWNNEGYGGIQSYKTLEEAKKAAQSSVKLGYGKADPPTQIHIRKVTTELVYCIDQGEEWS